MSLKDDDSEWPLYVVESAIESTGMYVLAQIDTGDYVTVGHHECTPIGMLQTDWMDEYSYYFRSTGEIYLQPTGNISYYTDNDDNSKVVVYEMEIVESKDPKFKEGQFQFINLLEDIHYWKKLE